MGSQDRWEGGGLSPLEGLVLGFPGEGAVGDNGCVSEWGAVPGGRVQPSSTALGGLPVLGSASPACGGAESPLTPPNLGVLHPSVPPPCPTNHQPSQRQQGLHLRRGADPAAPWHEQHPRCGGSWGAPEPAANFGSPFLGAVFPCPARGGGAVAYGGGAQASPEKAVGAVERQRWQEEPATAPPGESSDAGCRV